MKDFIAKLCEEVRQSIHKDDARISFLIAEGINTPIDNSPLTLF